MLDQEGIKNYVTLYGEILNRHQITASDDDLNKIYNLILLIFKLDDLYDSANDVPDQVELNEIREEMIALMPNCHPIAMNAIQIVFTAMHDEAHSDLSQSLNYYLSICGKSIGAQLIASYLASKEGIDWKIWFSNLMVEFNNEINDIIRLANDYLDITVDVKRMSEEVSQIKATHFFSSKLEFKNYLCYRYFYHKIRYYLYLARFKYLNLASQWRDYLVAINCAESVLDFAVKTYITDKKSGREPEH